MSTRRSLLGTLVGLGVAGGGAWWLKDRLFWPTATVEADGADSGLLGFVDAPLGLALIPVAANGVTTTALIDSGAQASIVDHDLAEALNLPSAPAPPLIAMGAGGGGQAARGVDLRLEAGGLTFSRVRAAVLELGPLSDPVGGAAGMVIGQDILQAVTADLDFPNRSARLTAGAATPPQGATAAPVTRRGRGLEARLRVEETVIDLLVDTGASAALVLSPETARGVGLFDGRPSRETVSIVLGGASPGRAVEVRTLTFAGEDYGPAEAHVLGVETPLGFPRGLLGLGVLGRHRVWLDMAGGRMSLG